MRKPDNDIKALLTEEAYIPSDDPEQMRVLTKVQGFMREIKLRHSVLPTLKVVNEYKRLARLKLAAEKEAEQLGAVLTMIEKSKVYKREAQNEKPEFVFNT